jgi:copper chaperone
MKTITISIQGMQEPNDMQLVKEALYDVWGVDQVEISFQRAEARLSYDEKAASDIDFEQAIVDQGFQVGEGEPRA